MFGPQEYHISLRHFPDGSFRSCIWVALFLQEAIRHASRGLISISLRAMFSFSLASFFPCLRQSCLLGLGPVDQPKDYLTYPSRGLSCRSGSDQFFHDDWPFFFRPVCFTCMLIYSPWILSHLSLATVEAWRQR